MMSLSGKSEDEIADLLDEYGIKHGPVVASTRNLYEKKIREAMGSRGRRVNQSSDKTFYREEHEEVTYMYRTPAQNDTFGSDRTVRMPSDWSVTEYQQSDWSTREYQPETSYSPYTLSVPRSRPNMRLRDVVEDQGMYDMPSSQKSSCLQPAPVMAARAAPDTNTSSNSVSMWLQIAIFLAVVVFLYLVFCNMEINESFHGIE